MHWKIKTKTAQHENDQILHAHAEKYLFILSGIKKKFPQINTMAPLTNFIFMIMISKDNLEKFLHTSSIYYFP